MKIDKKGCLLQGCPIANTILYGVRRHWVGFLLVWLVSCPIYGQVLPKKPVTESDYHLWGTLYADKISDKGKWVSYMMRYEEGQDTLFVKRSDGKKTHSFAKAGQGRFCGERTFACVGHNGTLNLLDLEKGSVTTIGNVEDYSFSGNEKYLITLEGQAEQKTLHIRNLEGLLLDSIPEVDNYKQNKDGTAILCTYHNNDKGGIVWVKLGHTIEKSIVVEESGTAFSQLVWHNEGDAFTALKTATGAEGATVFYYSFREQKGYYFNPAQLAGFPSAFFVESGNASGLTISTDGNRVFFSIRKKAAYSKSFDGVQQWNGNDAITYSERQHMGDSEFNTKIMVWWPQSGKFRQVTDDSQPFGLLNGTQDFALTFSQTDLAPQYKLDRNVNYYVTDLETGQRNLLLENQSTELFESSFSPKGKYFAYFKENNWWVYNFRTQKHSNVTAGVKLQLSNEEDKSWKSVYRVAGWGNNEAYLLIYDQYDIWKISLEGSKVTRLTKGREKGISYAIVPQSSDEFYFSNFSGHVDAMVDVSQDILLIGNTINKSNYFVLEPNGKLKTIASGDFRSTEILKAKKAEAYVFEKEQYNSPPELVISNGIDRTPKRVFQSNPHHYKYVWGKQEIISYSNAKNVPLQGILYYPADYDPDKKYPMIVSIYEKQTYLKNYYFNPSLYNITGFNVANLTAQGYFVLFPDIEHELGNPGLSATDCVMAATKKVIDSGLILPDKIALMGQSFGGYETNFIVTQTNLFATAVSSASVFDLASWYLSIGAVAGLPEIWRFESQQWRMGKSMFEDRKGYERNSPATYVENVKTPMLLWAGELDTQINNNQSIAFYLALRRLKKKEIMLVYPKDSHSLVHKENQKDLTHRLDDWLGYYLKGELPKEWIKEGIQ